MKLYTMPLFTDMHTRKIWDLDHFWEIRIATPEEADDISRQSHAVIMKGNTYLLGYNATHFAILDVNTPEFLMKLMEDIAQAMDDGTLCYDVAGYYAKLHSLI